MSNLFSILAENIKFQIWDLLDGKTLTQVIQTCNELNLFTARYASSQFDQIETSYKRYIGKEKSFPSIARRIFSLTISKDSQGNILQCAVVCKKVQEVILSSLVTYQKSSSDYSILSDPETNLYCKYFSHYKEIKQRQAELELECILIGTIAEGMNYTGMIESLNFDIHFDSNWNIKDPVFFIKEIHHHYKSINAVLKIILKKDFSFHKYDAEEYRKWFQTTGSLKHNRNLEKEFAFAMQQETLDSDDLLFIEGYIHCFGIEADHREEVTEKAIELGCSRIFKALLKRGLHTTKELRKKMRSSSSKFIRDYANKEFRETWKSQKPELNSKDVLKKIVLKILSAYQKVKYITLEMSFLMKYADFVGEEDWLLILWLLQTRRSAVFEVYRDLFQFDTVLSAETDNNYEFQFQCEKKLRYTDLNKQVLIQKLQGQIERVHPDTKGFFKLQVLFSIARSKGVYEQLCVKVRSLDFLKADQKHPLTEFFLKVCLL